MKKLLALLLLLVSPVFGDSTGAVGATTGSAVAMDGVITWASISNALGLSTSSAANSSLDNSTGDSPSYGLLLTGYSFGTYISSGDTIDQIDLEIYHGSSGTIGGRISDYLIKLAIGGVASGNNKATNSQWLTGTASYVWNAGAGDTMPTADEVIASNFGVVIQAEETHDDTKTALVYYASLTITYTPGSGGGTSSHALTMFFPLP